MEEAFRALLLADAAVMAASGGRVNWGEHPQGQPTPYVVLTVISDAEAHTMRGPCGLSQGRVQVDCYAVTYGGAKTLSRAVRAALDGHSDANFGGVFLDGSRDSREGGSNEAERLFRVSLDFLTNFSS